MIISYVAEENIFAVIAYIVSLQNGKETINIPKKDEYVKFKNVERKMKVPFMIHVDFESILVSEDNGKQNPNESYTNKY